MQVAKKPTLQPAVQLHKAVGAHYGLLFSKSAVPASVLGRVTMLAKGPKVASATRQLMLAERDDKKLGTTQAKAALQIKKFAASLLSSQKQAAAELHDLEQHFG